MRIPVSRIGIGAVFAVTALLVASSQAQVGISGTISYRDGTASPFEWIGPMDGPIASYIDGRLGAQTVRVPFSDLREVVFTDRKCGYHINARCEAIVVNKRGERFTLNNVRVDSDGPGHVTYVVRQNPVSGVLMEELLMQWDHQDDELLVVSIGFGEHVGNMKRNPETGEFFPPTFVYDPYTGTRLDWATP